MLSDEQFAPIAGDPFLMGKIKAIRSDNLYDFGEIPDNALPVLDELKKTLDSAINAAKADPKLAHKVARLVEKRDKVVAAADAAFPDYPAARAAFAGESPAVNELEQGVVGQIAKLKDTQAQEAADRLMNASRIGPLEALRVRNAI